MPIAYHQQTFATLASGWARRSASQIFSPATRLLGWRQNMTSPRSRKNQPLPTAPCSAGIRPVRKVDCTEQVTAGSTVPRVARLPRSASARNRGMSRSARGVSPTTSRRSTGRGAVPVVGAVRWSVVVTGSP